MGRWRDHLRAPPIPRNAGTPGRTATEKALPMATFAFPDDMASVWNTRWRSSSASTRRRNGAEAAKAWPMASAELSTAAAQSARRRASSGARTSRVERQSKGAPHVENRTWLASSGKSDMRHNRHALRWVVLAVIIILLAVASPSYFAQRREAAAEGQGTTQAPQTPATTPRSADAR